MQGSDDLEDRQSRIRVMQRHTRGTAHANPLLTPSLGVLGLTLEASRNSRELMSSVLFVSCTILSSVLTTGNLFFLYQLMPLFLSLAFLSNRDLLSCFTVSSPGIEAPREFLLSKLL